MGKTFEKTTSTRQKARLSALLCLVLVLGAMPGAVPAGAVLSGSPGVVSLASAGFVGWEMVSAGVEHSFGIRSDGSLWAWGLNGDGQLGDGTTTDRSAPVRVGTEKWQAVGAGWHHSLGIREDDSLWAWGRNYNGQLGDGTTTSRNTPVQVGTDKWQAVGAGDSHSLALKADGSLWAWGYNGFGQLGIGTTTDRNAPVQVGTDKWQAVGAGAYHSLALKADGSLWTWGSNSYGQLGIGTTTSRNTPVQVGAEKWKAVGSGYGYSLGIKADGSLWAWGYNYYGQLGDGTTTDRNAPVRIGTDTNWAAVSAGDYHSLGIREDGSLWAWGQNGSGQLGDGTTTNKNIPVRIGIGTDWAAVSAGGGHSLAIKADRSLWAWGNNTCGQLGDGTTIRADVPTLVDGPGTITRVYGADRFATAIEVSKRNFESADAVIIATGMNYADALSASALAGSLQAPLLLTKTESLSPGVQAEIERLGAEEAWVMGSTAAVSQGVEDALEDAGLDVFRLEGADRYETSAEVAYAVAYLEDTAFAEKAFLARGDNFADGLAVSPLAYKNKVPVVLTRPTELSWPAAGAIEDLGITDVTVLGSTAAVSQGVEDAVRVLDTHPVVRRVAGADRYRTAEEVAKYAFANSLAAHGFIGVATGLNFPDALAGGAAAGERGGVLVLTAPEALSANWASYLPSAYAGTSPDIQVYGGSNVVSDAVFNTLKAMLID